MRVHLRKRKTSYGFSLQLDYFLHGQRIREHLDIQVSKKDPSTEEKMHLAEQLRMQREMELTSGSYRYTPKHLRSIDFFAYFDGCVNETSRRDVRMFKATLAKLRDYHTGPLPASAIDKKFCTGFFAHLNKELNGESPFNYFSIFRKVLNNGVEDGLFTTSPAIGVKSTKPKHKALSKEVLSDEEIVILSQTPCGNNEVKRAFLFCCMTGLRPVDVYALRWKNIDLRNKVFKFPQSKTGVRMLPPLNESAISILGIPGEPMASVFTLPSSNGINKDLKNWMKKAGITKHITFYSARHSFATNLLIFGGDLKTVSELMGHTTTRHTERYLHVSDRMKRKAVDALPVITMG